MPAEIVSAKESKPHVVKSLVETACITKTPINDKMFRKRQAMFVSEDFQATPMKKYAPKSMYRDRCEKSNAHTHGDKEMRKEGLNTTINGN